MSSIWRGPHAKKYGSASIEGGNCQKIAPTGLGRGRSPPNSSPTATRPQTTPPVLASAAADRHQLSRNVTCRLVQIVVDFMQRHTQRQRLANRRCTLCECHSLLQQPLYGFVCHRSRELAWRGESGVGVAGMLRNERSLYGGRRAFRRRLSPNENGAPRRMPPQSFT